MSRKTKAHFRSSEARRKCRLLAPVIALQRLWEDGQSWGAIPKKERADLVLATDLTLKQLRDWVKVWIRVNSYDLTLEGHMYTIPLFLKGSRRSGL
jgi:hypothetical protein